MSILNTLSYAGNAIFSFGAIGAFLAGRRSKTETNEAQKLTIDAQRERIDLLMEQNEAQQKTIDALTDRVNHLEETILYGSANARMVQEGPSARTRGTGRKSPPGSPASPRNGGV